MPEGQEIAIKMALSILSVVVISWGIMASRRERSCRPAYISLIVLAGFSAATYYNFGKFHGRAFIHHWEFFHYYLNSKYFPELGYDGLYSASLKAQTETDPIYPRQATARDLRNNKKVFVGALRGHQDEVRERFSQSRWEQFSKDNSFFLRWNRPRYLELVRSDHGFNATPTWSFTARLFDGWLPATLRTLDLLACLDISLLAVMFVVIFRTYGSKVGAVSLIIFGLNYASRYYWIGGALLRQDWLAASVVGVCMLRSNRHALAGALFGYATMVRVFPVIFLLGPLVLVIKSLITERRIPNWAWRLGLAYVLALVICLAAGSLAGRGASAWTEYAGRLAAHHETWLTNNVGLQNVLLYGPETFFRRTVDWSLPEPWTHWQAKMNKMKYDRRHPLALAIILYVGMIAAAAWRASVDEAAALGMGAIYAFLLLTCYYWAMLLMLPFKRGSQAALIAFLGFNVFWCLVHFCHTSSELRYGLLSWGLGLLFIIWALPDAIRTLRHSGAEPQSEIDANALSNK